jgi:uncharacterized membrane protein
VPTLTVCKFDSPDGAERALRSLERLGRRVIAVQDAAVVAWAERDPKPRAYQARSIAGPDPLSSAFWGFLFGVAFLLPLAGDAAPAGLTRIGLTDQFLHRLRDRIRPGTSALFLLVPTPATEQTLGAAEVIQTAFSRRRPPSTERSQSYQPDAASLCSAESSTVVAPPLLSGISRDRRVPPGVERHDRGIRHIRYLRRSGEVGKHFVCDQRAAEVWTLGGVASALPQCGDEFRTVDTGGDEL